jgi:TolA-binding protein
MFKKSLALMILTAVLLTGCSQQYSAEKFFYRATKYSADIFKDAKNIPPYQFEKAIANFQIVIDKFPETDQAAESYFKIGNLYVLQEKYQEALAQFRKVLAQYPEKKDLMARATMAIAGCYEKTNDWDNTHKYLREAFEKYPDVPSTLPIPAGIITYYLNKKDKAGEERAYAQAVSDYKGVIAKYPDTPLAYSAKNILVEVYMQGGDWADVLSTLNGLVKNFPQSPDAPTWLMTMGATYDVKLKDKVKARGMYQIVKDKYSQSPWAKEADKRLQALR